MEFRGVLEENGQQFFSIYDTATKRSRWVSLNDATGDVVVKNYDADAHSISLERNGQPLSLTLKSGPRIAQNIQAPMQPGMQAGTAGLPGMSPQNLANAAGKSPEAQRMQQIAEEIRRRRALRQQAPNMPTPGAPTSGGPTPLPGMSTSNGPMPMVTPGTGAGPMPIPGTGTGPIPLPMTSTPNGAAPTPTR